MQASRSAAAEPAERLGLELVPRSALFVLSVRPAEIAANEDLRELAQLADQMVPPLKESNMSVRDIRELMIIAYGTPPEPATLRTVVRFADGANQKKFTSVLESKYSMKKSGAPGVWTDNSEQVAELDPATIVIERYATVGPTERPAMNNPRPRWAAPWEERKNEPVVAVIDAAPLRPMAQRLMQMRAMGGVSMQVVAPVIDHADWAIAALELKDKLRLAGTVKCDSEESTKSVGETLEAVTVLMKNLAREQSTQPVGAPGVDMRMTQLALMARMSKVAGQILEGAEFKVDGDRVQIAMQSQLSAADLSALAKSLLPAMQEARQAAQRAQYTNNLKVLALAMHNYASAYRTLPAAQSHTYRANGMVQESKYPHSWRIDVLPFVEEVSLHGQYHFDEPWDSDANKKIMEKMPSVFRSPSDRDPKSTNTSFFVLTGPDTIFDGEKGGEFRRITDGTSMTLLIVEANRQAPWTKPEDIPYAADKPVPKLGGTMPDGFLAAFADGSVRTLPNSLDEATLRALITKAGGETIANPLNRTPR
jgi:hypothetical protein